MEQIDFFLLYSMFYVTCALIINSPVNRTQETKTEKQVQVCYMQINL